MHVEDDRLANWLLHRRIELDGATAALAARLDGSREWGEVRAELVEAGHDGLDVDRGLRSLLARHLVEGAGDELAARLERVVHRTEAVPTSILDGARFGCQGSGACCTGYSFGPLEDADVARLDALDLAGAFPDLEAPYVIEDERGRYLRRVDDHCVFLGADRLCRIHATFGGEHKPGFCRLYPLDSFATLEGVRVVDRGSCATFGTSARVGLPLVDDLDRVRALLDEPRLHHPDALVDDQAWDYGLYLRFTTAATTLVKQGLGTAAETLYALGRVLDALSMLVASCPLEPGQPDEVVTRLLASEAAPWYRRPRPRAAARGLDVLVETLGELAAALAQAIEGRQARSSLTPLRELCTLVEDTAERVAGHEGEPPEAAWGADVDQALRTSMRQQLFGRHSLVRGHAGAGLVRIGLIQLLALAAARAGAGARALGPDDLNRGHMLATRGFYTGVLDGVLVEREPEWRPLLDGLEHAVRIVAAPAGGAP